jgi:hypothetical protein
MHEPILALSPLVGLATTVGVGALMHMTLSTRSKSPTPEHMTKPDTDHPAHTPNEETPK